MKSFSNTYDVRKHSCCARSWRVGTNTLITNHFWHPFHRLTVEMPKTGGLYELGAQRKVHFSKPCVSLLTLPPDPHPHQQRPSRSACSHLQDPSKSSKA